MEILDLLIFLVPIYIANSSPVVLGGGAPLDFGKNFFDGKRILGDGKTIRGFIGGIAAGTVAGGIAAMLYHSPFFADAQVQFIGAFILASGTLIGDGIGSFIKRRFGRESGTPFFLDTEMFLVVALLLAAPFVKSELYEPINLVFFLVLTAILHPLTNLLANKAGLKKVPW